MVTLFFIIATSLQVVISISNSATNNNAIVLFGPRSGYRIHDNPCLTYCQSKNINITPILVKNPTISPNQMTSIEKKLSSEISNLGGQLYVNSNIHQTKQLIEQLSNANDELIVMSTSSLQSSGFSNRIKYLEFNDKQLGIKGVSTLMKSNIYSVMSSSRYNDLKRQCPKPQMTYDNLHFSTILNEQLSIDYINQLIPTTTNTNTNTITDTTNFNINMNKINILEGNEDTILALLKEYLLLGDIDFSKKYAQDYVLLMSSIPTHYNHQLTTTSTTTTTTPQSSNKNTKEIRVDTLLSLLRLQEKHNYFQGEVISGILSHYMNIGCISPHILIHARSILFDNDFKTYFKVDRPLVCRLTQEAIRKDWHNYLSEYDRNTDNIIGKETNSVSTHRQPEWEITYDNWKGYTQRIGFMKPEQTTETTQSHQIEATSNKTTEKKQNVVAVLIHGFGGSLDQYTTLARELVSTNDDKEIQVEVLGLDSLGFGKSEKPPLSYNQYLWRDQVVDILKERLPNRDIILIGNSIGGFTATSVAADLSTHTNNDTPRVKGLVLLNSAGRALSPDDYVKMKQTEVDTPKILLTRNDNNQFITSTTTITSTLNIDNNSLDFHSINNKSFQYTTTYPTTQFPSYQGPAPELLRIVGKGIFSGLQPRITSLCQWLYPTNPSVVIKNKLDKNIYRDSEDLGATDVIAAGGKLPPPQTMNELLHQYTGPVLISQGILDPLNDAKTRASLLGNIRDKITVDLLELGHCPMDENPQMVSKSIKKWISTYITPKSSMKDKVTLENTVVSSTSSLSSSSSSTTSTTLSSTVLLSESNVNV